MSSLISMSTLPLAASSISPPGAALADVLLASFNVHLEGGQYLADLVMECRWPGRGGFFPAARSVVGKAVCAVHAAGRGSRFRRASFSSASLRSVISSTVPKIRPASPDRPGPVRPADRRGGFPLPASEQIHWKKQRVFRWIFRIPFELIPVVRVDPFAEIRHAGLHRPGSSPRRR